MFSNGADGDFASLYRFDFFRGAVLDYGLGKTHQIITDIHHRGSFSAGNRNYRNFGSFLWAAFFHVCHAARDHRPLRFIQVAAAKVFVGNKGVRIIASEIFEARRDPRLLTGTKTITPVENCIIEKRDRLAQPIGLDRRGQLIEFRAFHQREKIGEGVEFHGALRCIRRTVTPNVTYKSSEIVTWDATNV